MAVPSLSWHFTTFLQKKYPLSLLTKIHDNTWSYCYGNLRDHIILLQKAKEKSQPAYSASQAEGEVRWAVRLISGRHNGVSSRRQAAGQTDILRVAVRDTTGYRILVSGKCLLRFLFLELDTQQMSNAHQYNAKLQLLANFRIYSMLHLC